MALTGPKSKRTFGKPLFEPHGSGPWVIFRNPQLGYPRYVCLRPDGLVGESRQLEEACRFRSADWAAAFVITGKLDPSIWRIGKRPQKE